MASFLDTPAVEFRVDDEATAQEVRAVMDDLWPTGPDVTVGPPPSSGWWTDGRVLSYEAPDGTLVRDEGPLDPVSLVLLARSMALPPAPALGPAPLEVPTITVSAPPAPRRPFPDFVVAVGFSDRYDGFDPIDDLRVAVDAPLSVVRLEGSSTIAKAPAFLVAVATPRPERDGILPVASLGLGFTTEQGLGVAPVLSLGAEAWLGPAGARIRSLQRLELDEQFLVVPTFCMDLLVRPRRISAVATRSDPEIP